MLSSCNGCWTFTQSKVNIALTWQWSTLHTESMACDHRTEPGSCLPRACSGSPVYRIRAVLVESMSNTERMLKLKKKNFGWQRAPIKSI